MELIPVESLIGDDQLIRDLKEESKRYITEELATGGKIINIVEDYQNAVSLDDFLNRDPNV